MSAPSEQTTAADRERYFAAREVFEAGLQYWPRGQVEAIIALMQGRAGAAARRLKEEEWVSNTKLA